MNILSKRPVSLAEANKLMKPTEEPKPVHLYFKEFANLSESKAKECMEEIRALNNPKVNEEILVKLADFLPEDMEDLNKIFNEASLSEDEAKAILDIVSKY